MKVYILVRKEWVYRPEGYDPQSECKMSIIGVFDDLKTAKDEARIKYDEFHFFRMNDYVYTVESDREDLNGLFEFDDEHLKVIDHTNDVDKEIRWEVLEWMVGSVEMQID